MFRVGDRVVYPMHGAGTIEGIEQKEILGKTHKYYVLQLPISDMKVTIPVDNTEEIGLRDVIEPSEVPKVLEVLKQDSTPMSNNWNRRYRTNLEKIKSGDIYEVASVVRNLSARNKEKDCPQANARCWKAPKKSFFQNLSSPATGTGKKPSA